MLGADELTQSLPDEAAEVLDGLSPDGTPDFRSGVRSILRAAAGGSGGALRSGLRLCAVLLAMVTLCAVVHMSAQKDPVNAVSAVGALGICAACLGGMQSMISLASETVTRLSDYSACTVAKLAGAAFVKTSTGYSTGGATVEDVRLMRETVGPEMGVKASGGVRTYDDAIAMLKAGANRLGCSSTMKIVSGVKEDEHMCVNCGNCKNQCPSGNVEIRKKLY